MRTVAYLGPKERHCDVLVCNADKRVLCFTDNLILLKRRFDGIEQSLIEVGGRQTAGLTLSTVRNVSSQEVIHISSLCHRVHGTCLMFTSLALALLFRLASCAHCACHRVMAKPELGGNSH